MIPPGPGRSTATVTAPAATVAVPYDDRRAARTDECRHLPGRWPNRGGTGAGPRARSGRAVGGGGGVRDLRVRPPHGVLAVRQTRVHPRPRMVGDRGGRERGGSRVVFTPTPGCGTCRPCRRGRPSVCRHRAASDLRDLRGAFARYTAVGAA